MTEFASLLLEIDTMQRALTAMRTRVVALAAHAEPVKGGLIPPKLVTAQAAAGLVRKNEYTIKRWCKNHGIGHKMGGQWYVDVELLQAFVQNGNVNVLHA